MAESPHSLVQLSPQEWKELTDGQAQAVSQMAQTYVSKQTFYASLSMVCGNSSLLSFLIAFVYLVMNNHSTEAYVVLGSAMLSLVGRIIGSRL